MIKNLPYEFRDLEIAVKALIVKVNKLEGTGGVQEEIDALRKQIAELEEELEINKVPIGTIVSCGVNTGDVERVPKGYLRCIGEGVTKAEYPELFEAIGLTFGTGWDGGVTSFTLPDLRGLVPRGVGSTTINGNLKVGGYLGQVQEDQMQKITGQVMRSSGLGIMDTRGDATSAGALSIGDENGTRRDGAVGSNNARQLIFDSSQSPDARTSATTDGETRVSSLSLNFIIKAK